MASIHATNNALGSYEVTVRAVIRKVGCLQRKYMNPGPNLVWGDVPLPPTPQHVVYLLHYSTHSLAF